jgi:hypothetical protein
MAKSKKTGRRKQPKKKTSQRRQKSEILSGQTNQPFEQDTKRRIGQYGGEGNRHL